MSLLDEMPHESTIRRRTRTKSSLGGSKDSFVNEQTEVKCWEQPATAKEIVDFEKRGISINRKVYFPTNPSVTERHQILITKRQGVAITSPTPLEVKTILSPDSSAGLGVLYKVMVEEVTSRFD